LPATRLSSDNVDRLSFLVIAAWMLAGADCVPDEQAAYRVQHELTVILTPADHHLDAEDVISFPNGTAAGEALHFVLHADLQVESADPGYILDPLSDPPRLERFDIPDEGTEVASLREYRLRPRDGTWPAEPKPRLRFQGEIYHPLVTEGEEYARSFSRTPGTIGEEGVVLSGSSFWVPSFGKELVSFRLTVTVPEGWDAVSQGERTLHVLDGAARRVRWDSPEPMDEVYLIAGRFTEYSRKAGDVTAYAFLRAPDPNLAAKYLEATAQYVAMYSQLIGPYPYKKFALVENFWETGYGMPSFTLLGSKVIRFPFILHSSYPHEILHNWWGNSVLVEYEQGNWSEGLTAYLADHLIKENQGRGIDYRLDTLNKYRDYVRDEQDFSLSDFLSRHSSASEAVGYGKALMLWHMLRLRLGDEKFTQGLRRVYRLYRFRRASFADFERIYSEVAQEDLEPFFEQWVERTGAPVLSVEGQTLADQRIRIAVRQEQAGDLYELTVPLAVTVAAEPKARIFPLSIKDRESEFEIPVSGSVLRIDLDPYFDVFRRLHRGETPPTLSDLFGAAKVTLVLPEGGSESMRGAWQDLVHDWSEGAAGRVEVVPEQDLRGLPPDRAVWVLGRHNRWGRAVLSAVERYGAGLVNEEIHVAEMRLPERGHSFVYTAPHPAHPDLALAWVGADGGAAISGLARKLPHYGRYSFLAFAGDEPRNVAKGKWPALDSPLVRVLAPAEASNASPSEAKLLPPRAQLPQRRALARLGPVFRSADLMAHVEFLAADRMEGRGVGTVGLEKASDYIAGEFRGAGLQPGGDGGSYFQSWSELDGPEGRAVTLRNVIGVLPGKKAEWRHQPVVLGAHYDHLGRGWPDFREAERGQIYNGADDNASGAIAVLCLWPSPGRSGDGRDRDTT
jgi:hypothetical protein